MRLRLIVAVIAAATVLAACGGDTSVFALGVGDCFNDDPSGADEVTEVETVDCSEPHDNEVFFQFSLPDGLFPGQESMMGSAAEQCIPAFDEFVGMPYEASDLDILPITPTSESWDEGDRVVLCAVYALDLSKLTGSMRGANR